MKTTPLLVCVALLCAATVPAVRAQQQANDRPGDKPLVISLGTQAGSAADTFARLLAPKLAEGLKQSVVVENITGASGLIGAEKVALAAPDGQLIGLIGDSALLYASNLIEKSRVDPNADLQPITFGAAITWVLVTNPAFPARSVKELLAAAKARPGSIDYASGGNGSAQHVGMELFKSATGVSMTHIPYRGASQATADVVAGHLPVMFSALAVALPMIRDGKLRALAVPSETRSPLLPDVPTMAEAGVPGFQFTSWMAFFAPKTTPQPVVARLHRELGVALQDQRLQERFIAMGLEPRTSTPDQLRVMTRDGHAKMKATFQRLAIKLD